MQRVHGSESPGMGHGVGGGKPRSVRGLAIPLALALAGSIVGGTWLFQAARGQHA